MTHNRFWWNCKHIEVDNNLGVAFCTKNNDFCNKRKCTEIQVNPKKQYYRERIEELQNRMTENKLFGTDEELNTIIQNIHKAMEEQSPILDENGILWTYKNNRWHAGCTYKIKSNGE